MMQQQQLYCSCYWWHDSVGCSGRRKEQLCVSEWL